MEDIRNHSSSNIDETRLVGSNKPREELIKLMDVNTKNGDAKVICIVGMGGLGKTTLARRTYESKEDVVKHFSCCAWITISQLFLKIEMLKDMIRQLLGGESLKNCLNEHEGKAMQVKDLTKHLTRELKDKRYLIILDDLWTIDAWRWIKEVVLPSVNMEGCRIIVTTRDVGLAKECTHESLIYHLKPLELVDATNLLLRKSRRGHEDMKICDNFKSTVEKVVKKCGCLPLAVLTIGCILATKKIADWEPFYNQLSFELDTNPSLEAMRWMVTLSYRHLPSHLKSCFLYLSVFPEDFEIQRRRLVERWISERFVRARAGMTIEDVGKSYFNELIDRSMIQPSRLGIEGSVQSCRVHDIMRDVMVSIARDENFVYLVGDKVTSGVKENLRHVTYHGSKCQNIGIDLSHVRSMTMFGERPMDLAPSLCSPNFRMLRVLDLHNAQFLMTQKDINNIGLLCHLKCIIFRGYSNMYALPKSIRKLRGLQTLDIRNSYITSLPSGITELQNLRSLYCSRRDNNIRFDPYYPNKFLIETLRLPLLCTPLVHPDHRDNAIAEIHMACSGRFSEPAGVRVPSGMGNLNELQILEVVDIQQTSNRAVKGLGELIHLRKLSMVTMRASEQKCKIRCLCAAIEKLSSLCSLSVDDNADGTLEWLHSVTSPPPLLRTLRLSGCLGEEMPTWIGSLMHLQRLDLKWSELKEEKDLEILGALPKLVRLRLSLEAYVRKKLVFRAEAFRSLTKLYISSLDQLKEIRFEQGTSPHMEMIEIHSCRLKAGIIGIKHLQMLKQISLGDSGRVAKLSVLQGEVDTHSNHPVLRLKEDWRHHDLVDVIQVEEAASLFESSRSQVLVMPTTNVTSHGDLLYTYNSC